MATLRIFRWAAGVGALVAGLAGLGLASGSATGIGGLSPGNCISMTALLQPPCAVGTFGYGLKSDVVSADGTMVYAVNYYGMSINTFDRSAVTGAVSESTGVPFNTPVRSAKNAWAIVLSPDGRNAYTLSHTLSAGAIESFDRDPSTGALTQKSGANSGCLTSNDSGIPDCSRVPANQRVAWSRAQFLVASPDGRDVYAVGDRYTILQFRRNVATGVLTPNDCVQDVTAAGPCTGGTIDLLDAPAGLAMSPDGSQLYASLWLGQAVIGLSRDATTGRLSQPAGSGWCIADAPAPSGCTASASGAVSYPWSVAVSTDGTSVLVGGQSGYVVAFARDGVTGLLTERNCLQDQAQTPTNANCATAYGVGQADGVAISPDGLNGYVAGGTQLATMSINPQTAAITQLPGTAGCIWATGTGPECAEWDNADFGTTLAFSANGEDLYSASMSTLTQLRRPPARALVVSRSGTGTGAVASSPSGIDCGMTCTGTFADGTTAVLTATPQSGSSFAGWTGDCSGNAPACTVTMDGAKTATARFDPVPVVPAPGEATAPAEATEAPTASTSVPATLTVDSAAARVAGPVVELALPSAGKVTVVGTSAGVRSAVCAGTRTVRTGGTYHVGCTLTPAGRRVVSRHSIRVALRVAFAPTGGTREVQRTTVVMPRRAPHIVVTG